MNALSARRRAVALVAALVALVAVVTSAPSAVPASAEVGRGAARSAVLSGIVTDLDGRPVPGLQVYLFTEVPRGLRPAAVASTDARGRYRVAAVPGAYRVLYQQGEIRTILEATGEFWPRQFREETAGTVLLRSTAPTRLDVAITREVTVRGRVLGPDGRPAPRTPVFLHQVDLDGLVHDYGVQVDAAEDGTYSFPARPGSYRVGFEPGWQPEEGPRRLGGAWPDAADLEEGRTFQVGLEGRTLSDLRIRMTGSISGEISGSGPRDAVLTRLDRSGGDAGTAFRSVVGDRFLFPHLVPGRYRLEFPLTAHATSYWPGVADRASSQVIEIGGGQALTGYDAELVAPAVSGVVRTVSGTPAPHVEVGVQRRSGAAWVAHAVVETDEDGRYRVPVSSLGRYRVAATDPTTGRSTTPTESTVSLGRNPRVDPQVRELGALTGTVRSADGSPAAVDLYLYARRGGVWSVARDEEDRPVTWASGAGGDFRLTVPAGVYRLGASTPDGDGPVVFGGGATTVDQATSLVVAAGRDTTADLRLLEPGSISGRVMDSLGLPIGGAEVRLRRDGVVRGSWVTTTDDAGRYTVSDVPAGPWVLEVGADGFVTEQHPDPSRDSPVTVAPGADVTAADVVLGRGSTVTARVVDRSGRPVTGASVTLLHRRTSTGWVSGGHVSTDDDGVATIDGLPAATYRVLLAGTLPNGDRARLGSVRADGSPSPDSPVLVVGDDASVRIDRTLDSRGTMFGRVTGERRDTSPSVRLQRSRNGAWADVGALELSDDGRYVTPVLPYGTYRLRVRSTGRFAVTTRSVTVSSTRAVRTDVALTGRTIRGAVRALPLRSVLVQAIGRDGRVVDAQTTTPSHADFELGPLRPGAYTVRYRDPAGGTADLHDSTSYHGEILRARAAWHRLDVDVRLATQTVFAGRSLDGTVAPPRAGDQRPDVQVMRRSGSRWVSSGEVYQSRDGYWWAANLRAGVDYRLRFRHDVSSDSYGREFADGSRIVGGCTMASARSYTIRGGAAVLSTGTTTAPARWPQAGYLRLTRPPAVRGTPRVGGRLVVSAGQWGSCGVRIAYQWRRDGAAIPGASGAAYRPTRADAGHRLSVLVAATAAGSDGVVPFRRRGTTGVETTRTAVVRR